MDYRGELSEPTPFVDGDGCFLIRQTPSGLRFSFVVSQDQQSVDSLLELNKFFQCGNMLEYIVGKFDSLAEGEPKNSFFRKVPANKRILLVFVIFFRVAKEYRNYRKKKSAYS